jgi:hypothetical protein
MKNLEKQAAATLIKHPHWYQTGCSIGVVGYFPRLARAGGGPNAALMPAGVRVFRKKRGASNANYGFDSPRFSPTMRGSQDSDQRCCLFLKVRPVRFGSRAPDSISNVVPESPSS